MCLMKVTGIHNRIYIVPRVYVYLAILFILLPVKWVFAAITAALIHEFGHMIALKSFGLPLERIEIDLSGAIIKSTCMCSAQEMLCAIAGPALGLLTMLTARGYPELIICCFVQTAFNLIPILPLDGGRILAGVISWIFPQNIAERVIDCICVFFLLIITFGAFFVTVKRIAGILPLAVVALIAIKYWQYKNSLQRCYEQCTI